MREKSLQTAIHDLTGVPAFSAESGRCFMLTADFDRIVSEGENATVLPEPFSGLLSSEVPFHGIVREFFRNDQSAPICPGSRLLRADGALKAEVHGLSG